MTNNTSDAIKLYGTDELVEPMRTLTAGPVSCQFDQGALRFIKIHGKEAIRNIAFVVRDKDWGTYTPVLSNVLIDQQRNSFTVAFDAVCKDGQQEVRYKANITGSADGSLSFTGDYTAVTDFVTNRTGFVVLHPLNGVAGCPVTVQHANGEIKQSVFPELIDPVQPFKNIRALTHEVLPGVSVCCQMIGDAFEMEDHRQWNDASYKTYVRPLALPWPFTIPASESHQQSVTLTILANAEKRLDQVSGAFVDQSDDHLSKRCVITVSKMGKPVSMPQIGLGLESQHLAGATTCRDLLRILAPQQLVVWHELGKQGCEHLKQCAKLAEGINAKIELQAVIPDVDFKAELTELATQCRDAGLALHAVSVAPAMYLRSIMPGPSWPDVTDLADIYDEVRKHFPGSKVGGGMLSFFPELNRHRPPVEHLDFISHASNTITHACDDISVTENLEALPYVIKTCRAFAGGKPYHVGPSSIGMRFNPYGSKTMDNPNNKRIAMARMDPRQRGLVNAAWTAGYIAHTARGAIDCVNLHAPTGEFGIVNRSEDWSRPGFDDTGKQVYPVYHIVAGVSRAAGKQQLSTHSTMTREIEAFAYEDGGKRIVWVANLTNDSRTIEISGLNNDGAYVATLSLDSFEQCTQDSDGFEQTTTEASLPVFDIGPYSVVRLTVLAC